MSCGQVLGSRPPQLTEFVRGADGGGRTSARCSSGERSKPWCQELGFVGLMREVLVSRCFCLSWFFTYPPPGRQPITEIFPPCFSL